MFYNISHSFLNDHHTMVSKIHDEGIKLLITIGIIKIIEYFFTEPNYLNFLIILYVFFDVLMSFVNYFINNKKRDTNKNLQIFYFENLDEIISDKKNLETVITNNDKINNIEIFNKSLNK